ncbi:hypothetical protein Ndes2526B_g03652 [Nannochloris sp. 'desiccata']|nr:hypothetical protein KSW81_005480 [Chlorella desiccata (nom. nud.)]KAH7621312.1 hypothetical protein NADE_006577 [Chlorella desiccata (nom. nud.)]
MKITLLKSTVCQPQRCGRAQCHAFSHAASFIAPPRRVAQAAHTTRDFTVTRALEEGTDPEQFEGLDPAEDAEIPGTYRDAMTSNTPLGKAIKEVCSELDNLAALEKETLTEADALLKKLGLKTSLFDVPEAKSKDNE